MVDQSNIATFPRRFSLTIFLVSHCLSLGDSLVYPSDCQHQLPGQCSVRSTSGPSAEHCSATDR